jgi:hypothetical protein
MWHHGYLQVRLKPSARPGAQEGQRQRPDRVGMASRHSDDAGDVADRDRVHPRTAAWQGRDTIYGAIGTGQFSSQIEQGLGKSQALMFSLGDGRELVFLPLLLILAGDFLVHDLPVASVDLHVMQLAVGTRDLHRVD